MKPDAISIVEAAYDCESDTRTWLGRLLGQAAPTLDRGFGISVYMYGPGIAPNRTPLVSGHMDEKLLSAIMGMSMAYPEWFHRVNSSPLTVGTATKALQMTADAARSWPPFVEYLHPLGVRDITGVTAANTCPFFTKSRSAASLARTEFLNDPEANPPCSQDT